MGGGGGADSLLFMEIWAFHSINGEVLSETGEMGASNGCVTSLRTVCLIDVSLFFHSVLYYGYIHVIHSSPEYL